MKIILMLVAALMLQGCWFGSVYGEAPYIVCKPHGGVSWVDTHIWAENQWTVHCKDGAEYEKDEAEKKVKK